MIERNAFGILSDGTEVMLYRLWNNKGEFVELLNYGAAIHSINVRNVHGTTDDVSLGVAHAKALEKGSFEGVVIGRCANRIAYGKYEVDGNLKQLECNRNGHFLHGASGNYSFKIFQVQEDKAENKIEFLLLDTGEGGFDCNVDVRVSYTFDDNHRLEIKYDMTAHGDTILCPTNHTYFNLSGGNIREHRLRIYAKEYAVKGETGIPMGEVACVEGTPLDFFEMKKIGKALDSADKQNFLNHPGEFDDTYILSNKGFDIAAELVSEDSRRIMRVYTDMPALILFTPILKEPRVGKHEKIYKGNCAVCLETQFVPNAVNCGQFVSPLFRSGETLSSRTVYEFDIIGDIGEENERMHP